MDPIGTSRGAIWRLIEWVPGVYLKTVLRRAAQGGHPVLINAVMAVEISYGSGAESLEVQLGFYGH